eukprot:TRINITY_DN286_c2_g1_i1.p1 TRINITY_DN286_c2_g1~~TRINITY_DN286_c2_g1_i1.p1  ORF type:complete len:617 (-),score=142.85 TRINITY_DN286_c2_g1_i1:108-1892(-)
MSDKVLFVRELGSEEYDVLSVPQPISQSDGVRLPITLDQFKLELQRVLNKSTNIVSIFCEEVEVVNAFDFLQVLFKKEPRLEVKFEDTVVPVPKVIPVGKVVPPTPAPPVVDMKWLAPIASYPYSFGHSGTNLNGNLLILGGFSNYSTTNYAFLMVEPAITLGKMFKVKVRGTPPPPRERHTTCLIGRTLYVFGGFDRTSNNYYNTLHAFDCDTLTWSHLAPTGHIPEGRCGHSACVIDGMMYVFGGRVQVTIKGWLWNDFTVAYRNDLYCYDPKNNHWTLVTPLGFAPTVRSLHTATAVGKKMYIFGGANSTGYDDSSGFCDLYVYDSALMTWSECNPRTTPPVPCYGHSATHVGNNRVLVFGGKGYKDLNSIHILDLERMEWKRMIYAGNILDPRWGHSATLHGSKLVIFGGRSDTGYYNTFQTIDVGSDLREVSPDDDEYGELQLLPFLKGDANRKALRTLQESVYDLKKVGSQLSEQLNKDRIFFTGQMEEIHALISENKDMKLALENNTNTISSKSDSKQDERENEQSKTVESTTGNNSTTSSGTPTTNTTSNTTAVNTTNSVSNNTSNNNATTTNTTTTTNTISAPSS